jgi:hypothetical protein
MNLQDAHDYLGQLLKAGVAGELPFASLVEGMPCESAARRAA